jgi:AraC family transcriptional regulator of adaptative response / DNA-3-methyladenine glycosylase II
MELDPQVCYRALQTRDARFDGRFFTAVRSTGVYCRPVCPARIPKLENCTFVPSAAAARELGCRPCLRCRPEASPGTPAWLGTSATVSRALRLIAEGALDHASVGTLAERLGVGDRHLRRLFLQHMGATPISVAQTQRVLFAKKLIDETQLPMGEIAFSSGFASIRRFNASIRSTYGRAPSELRRRRPAANGTPSSMLRLRLPFRPPLDWDGLLAYLAPRANPGVEVVDGEAYRRTLRCGDSLGWVEVRHPNRDANELEARLHLSGPAPLGQVTARLARCFDLGAVPDQITAHLSADHRLRAQMRACPGLRIAGAWDGFELAVRAILGQQVTVRGATTLAGRVVEAFGDKLEADAAPEGLRFLFPTPQTLATADLGSIGLPATRAAAIHGLAQAVVDGAVQLDHTRGLDDTIDTLCALPGIGPWTAHYIAMRALREPDAFPAGDLGLRKAAARGDQPLRERELAELAEAWRPWRAYAAMALWTQPHGG